MEISSGLATSAAAILRGQARFDSKAQDVVRAAEAASSSSDSASPDSPELVTSMVGMRQESLINSMLYATYKKQVEQQQDLIDIAKPR